MITYQNGVGSTVLSHYTYTVYADGQRSQSSQTQNGSTTTYLWQYDALNRVTEERLVGVCTYQRIYDLTGNVKTYTATEDGQPSNTTSYLYNDQDQLLTETSPAGTISYGYDDNGSLTSKTTSGGTEGYSYDLQGRLRAYTPVTGPSVLYAYDPDGQRIGKTVVTGITEYVVDPYNPTGYSQVLAETTGMTTTCYIHGSDVIGQSVVGASPQYFLYDGHGSVRQLTMSTGLLVGGQDFWYDAWGNELTSNTPLTSYLYCGEQRDGETGLYYLRARMYDPQIGRFTSRDPFAGNGTDPQSLHKYLYCHGNPVNGIDPSGMFTLLTDFLTAFNLGEQLKAVKDHPNIVIRKGAEEVKDEIKDAFDWSDPMPIPVVAQNAEMLWVARLRMLGLNAIPMQSTAVGQHGPDILAFGLLNGKFHVLVGEVKGMKRPRVLSSLDRLSNGVMQMSADWIEKYTSLVANTLADAVVEAGAGLLPSGTGGILADKLKDHSQFELYLLRARYYSGEEWRLKGFRLMRIGSDHVGLGVPLHRSIEQEVILKNPDGLMP